MTRIKAKNRYLDYTPFVAKKSKVSYVFRKECRICNYLSDRIACKTVIETFNRIACKSFEKMTEQLDC